MKKTVIDMHDLQAMAPFFRLPLGTLLGKALMRCVQVDKVNEVHGRHCHLNGAAFTSAILSDPMLDIRYRLHNAEVLDALPQGAFITVANHPTGSVEGIILIDIFAARRPDFKVVANGVLAHIGAMADNFIPIIPASGKQQSTEPANVSGMRSALQHIRQERPVGFFPAGAVAFYDRKQKKVHDLAWSTSVARFIRKSGVPVIPVFFDLLNSPFFYWLGAIDWRVRTLRMPSEMFNKQGQTVNVYLGQPIFPEQLLTHPDDLTLTHHLYSLTHQLVNEVPAARTKRL